MAIYRGPGGPGDATADAANTAQLAQQYANDAATSAANAATSATNAATSASAASTSASNASTSASNAASSASSASTSATNSANSATAAQTAENNAELAESNAEAAQTAAEAAQAAAETAETNADASATAAATSASNAATSATAAQAAQTAAETAYDNFDDRYLGAKSSDPSLDNDGNALITGAIYFNTSVNRFKAYTGSAWVEVYVTGSLIASNNLSDLTNNTTARTNLGLGSIATQSASSVSITGGSITGITDLAVADGGTGASTAANARINLLPSYTGNGNKVLSLNSGATDVEWTTNGAGTVTSVDMTVPTGLAVSGNPVTSSGTLAVTYAAGYSIPTTTKQSEWDTAYTDRLKWDGGATGLNAATGRTSLGLGTAATTASTDYAPAAKGVTNGDSHDHNGGDGAQIAYSSLSGLPTLGTIASQAANNVSITGGSITGITDLAIADGGTGASTAADARTNLGLGSIATQAASSISITGGSITGITDLAVADGGTGASTATNAKINLEVITGSTGSSRIPAGTTGERDGTPAAGFFRFNSTVSKFEGYNGSAWGSVGGGATGGGSDEIFVENGQTVTTNYTLTTNKNAMSVGPITVNSGITVTVPSGSRWVVL